MCNLEHLLPGFSLELYSSAGRAPPRVLQGESDFLKRFHAASRVWEILLCDRSWLGLWWGGEGRGIRGVELDIMKHGNTQLFLDSLPLSCHGNPLIFLHTCRPGQTEPIRGAATSGGTKQRNNFGLHSERHGSGAQTWVWRLPLSHCKEKGGRRGGVMRWSDQPRWGKSNNSSAWWTQPPLYCSGDTPHLSHVTGAHAH